tara:strand:+ start:7782 stop:7994 length:213 start_codon:yes stop_codon:yes gene_type:complete
MSKNIFANIATDRFKNLIQTLSELEHLDRQRMSEDGKLMMNKVWELLDQPTFDEVEAMTEAQLKEENGKS